MKINEVSAKSTLPKPGNQINTDHSEFDKLVDYINQYCNKSLKIMQDAHRLLFRGIPNAAHQPFIGNSQSNRQPRDTKPKYHKAIDQKLKQAGFKARRSNSIFVTASHFNARDYGFLFVIFPFDTANITWSSEHCDLTTSLALQRGRQATDNSDWEITSPEFGSDQFIKEYGFEKDNLDKAIRTTNEIYINGNYLAIPFSKIYAYQLDVLVGRDHDHPNWFRNFASDTYKWNEGTDHNEPF